MTRVSRVGLLTVIAAAFALPARAELVFFSTGRVMSVATSRAEGDELVLTLRSGGEMRCAASLIARIAPDEVPYPVPETSASLARVAPPPAVAAPEAPFADVVARAASAYGVRPELVHAVIQVESAYQESARSPKGAMGLMQLMPDTARQYAVANPYDPAANVDAGVRHLKSLLDRFPLRVALAAYNAGEAAVARYGGVPPFPETRAYVSRVLKLLGS